MGEIYRNASRVITYLGPAAASKKEEARGIRLLQRLDAHFAANYELLLSVGSLWEADKRRSEFPVLELPQEFQNREGRAKGVDEYVSQGWRWLLRVAYGEWTQRLWIVQEQLLNEDIVMLHGPSLLSWDAVAIMSSLFYLDLLPKTYINRCKRSVRTKFETITTLQNLYTRCGPRDKCRKSSDENHKNRWWSLCVGTNTFNAGIPAIGFSRC